MLRTSYTGDGATKEFAVGLPFIDESHLRVVVNGELMTRGDDYSVQNPSDGAKAIIKFDAAPANAEAIYI